MESVKVLPGQSMLDVATQHNGGIASVFDNAKLSGRSITDDLKAGDDVKVGDAYDLKAKELFGSMLHKPATAMTDDDFDLDDDLRIFDETFDETFE